MKKICRTLCLLFIIPTMGCCQTQSPRSEAANQSDTNTIFTVACDVSKTIDPHMIAWDISAELIVGSLFEGLMTFNPDTARAEPGLATDWTISENGRIYTFTLREAAWSDGVPITAQTVVDSWLRVLNPATGSPAAWYPMMFIDGAEEYAYGEAGPEVVRIRALDTHILEVTATQPSPFFIEVLPHYSLVAVPMHIIDRHSDAWTDTKNIVSNGAFIVDSWDPNAELTLTRNESYWDANNVSLPRVRYRQMLDAATTVKLYADKEFDWYPDVPDEMINDVRQRSDYHISSKFATYYYVMNNRREPLDDPLIRKALAMSIDRQLFAETILNGNQFLANSFVPPLPDYPGIKGNRMNVEEAKQLLTAAGFPEGKGFPELTIAFNTSSKHREIAEFVQDQWNTHLQINVVLRDIEWPEHLSRLRQGSFDVARIGWMGDYQDPNAFLELFTSNNQNYAEYDNPSYDGILEDAALLPWGSERFALLSKAEEILITYDQVIIPLYHYSARNLIDTSVWGGWYTNTMDVHPIKYIYRK